MLTPELDDFIRCTRNMQSVKQGIRRKDRARQDFSCKSIDVISKGKQWNFRQVYQTFGGKFGIASITLIDNVLSRHKIISMAMKIPPRPRDLLTQH